ncbi:MAG: hypothetical protein ACK5XN_33900, partial [Bacteroidota bacterium]
MLGYFAGFFVSIVLKLFLNIGYYKTENSVLFTSEESINKYFSLYPERVNSFIIKETENSFDLLKSNLEKNKDKIIVDKFDNLNEILERLNGRYFNHDFTCLEVGNNDLFDYYWKKKKTKVVFDDESNNFFGARVLIIGNNEEIIFSFIEKCYQLECSSMILVTDSLQIQEKFSCVCKSIYFSSSLKFKDIEAKYPFDIIFDTYLIKSFNFSNYKIIIKELNDVIKNKKAIVSVVKNGILFEDWVLNTTKEIVLKKFYDSNYSLTSIVFRCGEFSSEKLFTTNTEKLKIFKNYYIQDSADIA